jgi:hypothetical protein
MARSSSVHGAVPGCTPRIVARTAGERVDATGGQGSEFVAWLGQALRETTAGGCDPLLYRLWVERRIELIGPYGRVPINAMDEIIARLAVAGCSRRIPVIITLPDSSDSTAALTLATLLLCHWWTCRQNSVAARPVLYLGTSIGIRDDLRKVTVQDLGIQLADMLGQKDLTRAGATKQRRGSPRTDALPSILTAYAPADVAGLVRRIVPAFIAADLGDHTEVPWAGALVDVAREQRIGLVMWVHDPLAVDQSACSATVVSLPARQRSTDPDRAFQTTLLRPMVFCGLTSDAIADAMGRASAELAKASKWAATDAAHGSALPSDAVRVHRLWLRVLELMPCPVDFYDAGVSTYWGLTSTKSLNQSCAEFRVACGSTYPEVAQSLALVNAHLSGAESLLRQTNPMWELISGLSMASRDQSLNLLFGSSGRRRLFLDAMLVKYGITEGDLETIDVKAFALSDSAFREAASAGHMHRSRNVIVGAIGRNDEKRLAGVADLESVDVALYAHQLRSFQSRVRLWSSSRVFRPDLLTSQLGVKFDRVLWPPERTTLVDPIHVDAHAAEARPAPPDLGDWLGPDLEGDLQRFYDLGGELEDPEVNTENVSAESDGNAEASPVCATAISVRFREGWRATLAPDQDLMFVKRLGKRSTTEVRFARDLRSGTEIVAIHGQRRQSLYDLLINSLHANPVVALQLAVIREWQRELAGSYHEWRQTGGDLNELVRLLQGEGSSITSTLAVRFWVSGQTIAPQDPKDIQRIAAILKMPFSSKHHRRIAAAASRLRGLHRGLSNRLTNWLDREIGGGAETDDLTPLDAEVGVTFADFASTLLHLTVESVQVRDGPFLRARLGAFEMGGKDE